MAPGFSGGVVNGFPDNYFAEGREPEIPTTRETL
jgi:hypothetical protein